MYMYKKRFIKLVQGATWKKHMPCPCTVFSKPSAHEHALCVGFRVCGEGGCPGMSSSELLKSRTRTPAESQHQGGGDGKRND